MARILVVDDAAFMRKMVKDALAGAGHEVVGEAGNGVEAVARYQELKPDLTTLDITMPEKDGLAALADIMGSDPSARVVMCSALGQETKVVQALKLGAKDFVVKPFQADRVVDAVGKALAQRPPTSRSHHGPPRPPGGTAAPPGLSGRGRSRFRCDVSVITSGIPDACSTAVLGR